MVTESTRVTETTASILDLFFTSNQILINKVEVIPGISDHEAVFIESSLRPVRVKTPPRKVFQYRKGDYEGMKQELKAFQIEFEELAKTEDVEQLWTRFKKKIHSLMESYIPAKTMNGNTVNKPWITKQVKSLTCKCKKLFAKQRKPRKAKDVQMYKETKARLQKTERQSYWKFIDNIIEVGDPDQEQQPKQKRFWAYIKSLGKDSSGIAPLKDNQTLHANPKDKADILIVNTNQLGRKRTKATSPHQMAHLFHLCQKSRSHARECGSCYRSLTLEKPVDQICYLLEC